MKAWLIAALALLPVAGYGLPVETARIASLDGGMIDIGSHDGPVLLVNTASLCAFTSQYDELQEVYERYSDQGLLVVAVPSDDFRQELDDEEAVAEFCDLNFDLTLPIAAITTVTGADAHPLYLHLKNEFGVAPRWNFTKFLLSADSLGGAWGPSVRPDAPAITRAIEDALE